MSNFHCIKGTFWGGICNLDECCYIDVNGRTNKDRI